MSARDAILGRTPGRTEDAEFAGTPVLFRSLTLAEASQFTAEVKKNGSLAAQYWLLCKTAMLDPETREPVFRDEDKKAFEGFEADEVIRAATRIVELSGLSENAIAAAGKGSDGTPTAT